MLHSRAIPALAILTAIWQSSLGIQSCSADTLWQQTIVQPAVVAPAVVPSFAMPLAARRTIVERRVLSVPVQTMETRTLTSSVLVSAPIGQISDFRHRLDMLRDQIALGEQNGLLSFAQAADLRARYDVVSSSELALESNGVITQQENDSLEQQINLLNQDVSNSMSQ